MSLSRPADIPALSRDWIDYDFGMGFEIKYKGAWYANGHYLNSLGISLIMSFGSGW
jgi:hypothetical protein